MMNSVGAEKDPYLQAYIQARMKNHVEEVKLQKVLANLEVGRRIKKIMLNMELFEDRKMAHKLKQEASDVETQKKKAIRKYLNSNKMAQFDNLHPNARIFRFTNVPQSPKQTPAFSVMERCKLDASTSSGGLRRTSVFPVTKGNTNNEPMDVKSAPHMRSPRQSIGPEHHPSGGNRVVNITVPNSPNRLGDGRKRPTNVPQITTPVAAAMLHADAEGPPDPNTLRRQSSNLASTPISAHPRPSLVGRSLTTPAIVIEGANGETERLKTAATVPIRKSKNAMDQRSVRTLPTLLPSHSVDNAGSLSPTKLNRPKTSSLWPGDPNAIRSVRRDRRKPEEMLSLVKNGEEARRMIRDMPPTCSKNCSKPDILQELGRSYSDLPNLLPAIEKARHAFARQEAANRDMPGDDLNAEESTEETGAMPVSQIQYMALRSMGGVRRNSVIA